MANYRRSEIVSGSFILLAIAVFALFAFKVGGLNLLWFLKGEKKVFETLLPDVQTLEVGAKVTVGGRRVGRVVGVEIALPERVASFASEYREQWGVAWEALKGPDNKPVYAADRPARVIVRFEVDKAPFDKVTGNFRLDPQTARAVLAQEGFLGPHFIQILPGMTRPGGDARSVFDDANLEGSDENPINLAGIEAGLMQTVIKVIGPALEEVQELLDKINNELMTEENITALSKTIDDLRAAVHTAREMAEGLLPLTQVEDPRSLERRLVKPANDLLVNMDKSVTDLTTQVKDLLSSQVEPLLKKGNDAAALATDVLATANAELKEAGPKMQKILDDLQTTTAGLEERLDEVQRLAAEVTENLNLLINDGRQIARETRPELAETLQSLRRTMWEAEMLARKLRGNPATIIWGDDEKMLGTWPTDKSGTLRSGRAQPYGQRDENEKK